MKFTRRDVVKGFLALGGSLLFSLPSSQANQKKEEPWIPAYEKLEKEGKFAERIKQAYALFENCQLCPRKCGVNRTKGEKGFCRAPLKPVVFSHHPHFGEEMSLVGQHGSGTIFFSNCNLRCIFCQNWPIAHEGRGNEIKDEDLADLMLDLQKMGCHNVNLVTPTHVTPNILNATRIALKKGLRLPLMYNTSGYERIEILKILEGIVDIYKPDMKYMDSDKAAKYSAGASDYPEVTKKAVIEMNRQVGVLRIDQQGIARRGVIIRHLVMPNRVAGSEKFVKWVSEALPKNTYVNIMAQYRVEYKAYEYPEIARGITAQEYLEAMDWAKKYGLTNLDPHSKSLMDFYQRRPG
ncbi:MAG TPA: radical SAM protein [Thermodesulfobacteriota bacterium]|nr:radical SAM protein [Thermodesulfobacteriota bacterium]